MGILLNGKPVLINKDHYLVSRQKVDSVTIKDATFTDTVSLYNASHYSMYAQEPITCSIPLADIYLLGDSISTGITKYSSYDASKFKFSDDAYIYYGGYSQGLITSVEVVSLADYTAYFTIQFSIQDSNLVITFTKVDDYMFPSTDVTFLPFIGINSLLYYEDAIVVSKDVYSSVASVEFDSEVALTNNLYRYLSKTAEKYIYSETSVLLSPGDSISDKIEPVTDEIGYANCFYPWNGTINGDTYVSASGNYTRRPINIITRRYIVGE